MKKQDSMNMLTIICLICTLVDAFTGLVPVPSFHATSPNYVRLDTTTICKAKVSAETLASIGYTVSVNKPLGVVFGENRAPFFGLVVDDVEPGQNGGKVGLRVGDQLLAVDGKPVVGLDFDSVMNQLKNSPDPLELDLYRGTVSSLFTIISNLDGSNKVGESDGDDNNNDDDDDDLVIMDESYESPVQVDMSEYEEEQSLSVSASNIVKNLGNIFASNNNDSNNNESDPSGKNKKKGIFDGMFSKETIQLDFDDGK